MKIAIPSKGRTVDSVPDDRFGRAPYFAVIDSDSGKFASIENPAASAPGGVGPQAVGILSREGVQVVITGRIGGNALTALKEAGIVVIEQELTGTVGAIYQNYMSGRKK
jgi:predicted Fe-Mo cluster-binding NifX family protein